MKLTKDDFAELNKTYRQTCRSVFGVGRVQEIAGDLAVVCWLEHSKRDLRRPELRTEEIPACFLRRIKPGLPALFQALLSASSRGWTRRNVIPYEWAVVAAEARRFLAEQGFTGTNLGAEAFHLANEFCRDTGRPTLAIETLHPELLKAA